VVADRLNGLEDRMTKLEATFEAEKHQLVTEAKAASSAAATMVAGGILSDAVTRITRLEHRAEQIESQTKRLSSPRDTAS
jgi:hypothetical protein